MNPDGTELQTIVPGNDEICGDGPVWAPDSLRLAFISEPSESTHDTPLRNIYVVNTDGTNLHKVASVRAGHVSLLWTPDGERVGIRIREPNEAPRHFLIGADGADELAVSSALPRSWFPNFWPQWLPE